MRYHNITHDDMLNGEGIRVVLWVAGCTHHCNNCHNPETWDCNSGVLFDGQANDELFEQLSKPYINGLTLSGGDPMHIANREAIHNLLQSVLEHFGQSKTIWLYTGYTIEQILDDDTMAPILDYVSVLVDGQFVNNLADTNYHWAGSTNQRVIDVQQTLKEGRIVLYGNH